jgi:hypothetical protein
MVDVSISGKKRFPAAGILMGATEQCLCEVKQCVSSPSVAKFEQAGELQKRRHVAGLNRDQGVGALARR